MEHACTPMARVLLMHLELLRRRAAAACGLLSLGLLVSYATLARSFAARWISLDQVTGRIKRSSVIARIRSLRGKRKPELLSRRFRRVAVGNSIGRCNRGRCKFIKSIWVLVLHRTVWAWQSTH